MTTTNKKKELSAEQKADCAKLKEIFESKKNELNLSQAKLAEEWGMTQASVSHYLNGTNALNPQIATQFAKALRISIGEFSEQLAMEISEMATMIDEEQVKELALLNEDDDDLLVMNVLNVEASAGFGSKGDIVEIVSQLKYVPEQFYAQYGKMNTDNIQVINVKGDSMLPTFRHGDLLFVDVTIEEFDGDGVYVFTCDDYTYVKRIQKQGSRYMVISDNSLYPAWELDQEIYIHGKVKIHQSQMLNFIG